MSRKNMPKPMEWIIGPQFSDSKTNFSSSHKQSSLGIGRYTSWISRMHFFTVISMNKYIWNNHLDLLFGGVLKIVTWQKHCMGWNRILVLGSTSLVTWCRSSSWIRTNLIIWLTRDLRLTISYTTQYEHARKKHHVRRNI